MRTGSELPMRGYALRDLNLLTTLSLSAGVSRWAQSPQSHRRCMGTVNERVSRPARWGDIHSIHLPFILKSLILYLQGCLGGFSLSNHTVVVWVGETGQSGTRGRVGQANFRGLLHVRDGVRFMSLFLGKVIPTQMAFHMVFMEKFPWGR